MYIYIYNTYVYIYIYIFISAVSASILNASVLSGLIQVSHPGHVLLQSLLTDFCESSVVEQEDLRTGSRLRQANTWGIFRQFLDGLIWSGNWGHFLFSETARPVYRAQRSPTGIHPSSGYPKVPWSMSWVRTAQGPWVDAYCGDVLRVLGCCSSVAGDLRLFHMSTNGTMLSQFHTVILNH